MLKVITKGDYKKTVSFLSKKHNIDNALLVYYGEKGVERLKEYTPKRTGKTADSWEYRIKRGINKVELNFINTNIQNGVNIAIIIQYGHVTKSGGYVDGIDYINPALEPIFDSLIVEMRRELRA